MKTLTALVITSALALGACGPTVRQYDNGSVKHYDCASYNGKQYHVTVTDDNRRSIGGVVGRTVEMMADSTSGTPWFVKGSTTLPQKNGAYAAGSIQFSYDTPSGQPIGCAWGTELPQGYTQCAATEIGAASAMLNAGAKDILE